MTRTPTAAATALLLSAAGLALPASSAAAPRAVAPGPAVTTPVAVTAAPLKPCYQAFPPTGASIPLSLSGGTPGDGYEVEATYPDTQSGSAGTDAPTTPFSATGTATTTLTDLFPDHEEDLPVAGTRVDLTVEDLSDAGTITSAIGSVLVTNLALSAAPKPANPAKPRTVAVSGTAFADKALYGFVTNKAGTKVLRRFALGRANVCGYVAHKAIVAPPGAHQGAYRLYVNPGAHLDKVDSISDAFSIEAG